MHTSFGYLITTYWVVQVGLLTPLTVTRHCLRPSAVFTSDLHTIFTMEGCDDEFAKGHSANLKGIVEGS